jgi:hypothetical protein
LKAFTAVHAAIQKAVEAVPVKTKEAEGTMSIDADGSAVDAKQEGVTVEEENKEQLARET